MQFKDEVIIRLVRLLRRVNLSALSRVCIRITVRFWCTVNDSGFVRFR